MIHVDPRTTAALITSVVEAVDVKNASLAVPERIHPAETMMTAVMTFIVAASGTNGAEARDANTRVQRTSSYGHKECKH